MHSFSSGNVKKEEKNDGKQCSKRYKPGLKSLECHTTGCFFDIYIK